MKRRKSKKVRPSTISEEKKFHELSESFPTDKYSFLKDCFNWKNGTIDILVDNKIENVAISTRVKIKRTMWKKFLKRRKLVRKGLNYNDLLYLQHLSRDIKSRSESQAILWYWSCKDQIQRNVFLETSCFVNVSTGLAQKCI